MSQDFFTASILPIKNKLYRFALSITSDTTEAEDIVQEVLVKIWQKNKSGIRFQIWKPGVCV